MTPNWSSRGRAAAVVLVALAAGAQANAAGCSVSSSGLPFGAYQPLTISGVLISVAVTSNASVSVVCTGIVAGGAYTIGLGPSLTGSGDRISTRYLANSSGGADMAFNVYHDPSYLTIWGNDATASVISGSIPTGDSNQSHTVYGKIPAGQHTLKAGSFSASLTMTLTYNP
jgi:spore coat protein U-like protein